MSHRDWRTRITDILDCSENIRSYVNGMDRETFLNDFKTIRAVAFELMTIGEASRAIPPEIRQSLPEIPWVKAMALRNVIVHEYYRIDEEVIWQTVQEDIPELDRLLRAISL